MMTRPRKAVSNGVDDGGFSQDSPVSTPDQLSQAFIIGTCDDYCGRKGRMETSVPWDERSRRWCREEMGKRGREEGLYTRGIAV